MAGRHRRPPAWRRLLTSLVRSRDKARHAALEAEVVALRATVLQLRAELDRARVEATVTPGWVTLELPLVKVALGDPADVASGPEVAAALAHPDRGEDAVDTEIVLEPTPAPADKLAWSVLANLPERPLLDPTLDRDQEPVDHAREAGAEPVPHRRTA